MQAIENSRVNLVTTVQVPLRIKDSVAAIAKLHAATMDDPELASRMVAVSALPPEMQQQWLLAHIRPNDAEPTKNLQVGCVVVIVLMAVIVGYEAYQFYNAITKQNEERLRAIYENQEVEKTICPKNN
jgi:hypothetical protein